MDDKNVTIVVGADADDPSFANAERDAGESPDPNDTSDPANDEVEDEPQERREVYALPTPIPEPTLEDTNPDGSDKYRNYEEFLGAHGAWVMDETARRVEERQVVTRTHEAIQTRHLAAVTEFKQTHSDFDAAMKSAKPVVAKLKQHLGPDALAIVDKYTLQDAWNQWDRSARHDPTAPTNGGGAGARNNRDGHERLRFTRLRSYTGAAQAVRACSVSPSGA